MREENKTKRQMQIERAAYAVLRDKGYAGTSMLNVAKHAKASNETLYNWYGDKLGLFRALVVRNAAEVKAILEDAIAENRDSLEALRALGPKLLSLLTGDRAIALNQAAAADPTGELGAIISEFGRETVAPLLGQVLERARSEGVLVFADTQDATVLYLNLLVGDLQIRRAIGREPEPDAKFIETRSQLALERFYRLVAAE